jgi:hypothetical protein
MLRSIEGNQSTVSQLVWHVKDPFLLKSHKNQAEAFIAFYNPFLAMVTPVNE